MIRIICTKCKNAYLQKETGSLVCPSCKAEFPASQENFLSGAQFYNEGDFSQANDCLMKYIVQNGAEPQAIFYKALCDGFDFDEDTVSLKDTYEKLVQSLSDMEIDLLPQYLTLANNESEKLEKALVEKHIRLFEEADAEKIKKEVTAIINIQNDAKAFRTAISEFVEKYNENSASTQINANFSKCFFVKPELATEIGNLKFNRITENIASHTVFTGILSTDIKNLEIYYRCIVMFFERNREKYDFLMASAEKFAELSTLLEEGQYSTIKGTATIGDKLKSAGYDFFQESLKDHDDDFEINKEPIVIIEIEPEEIEEETLQEMEDISSVSTEEVTEASAEVQDEIIEATQEAEFVSEASEKAEIVEESQEDVAEEAATDAKEITEEPFDELAPEEAEASEDIQETAEIKEDKTEETEPEEIKVIEIEVAEESSEAGVPNEDVSTEQPESAEETNDKEEKPKRKKSFAPIITGIVIVLGILALIGFAVIPDKINETNYEKASTLAKDGKYGEAAEAFVALGDYEDAEEKALKCKYDYAVSLEEKKEYEAARDVYTSLGDFEDSKAKIDSCTYNLALLKLDDGKYEDALKIFETIPDYADSSTRINECNYQKALSLIEAESYEDAIDMLDALKDYSDSAEKILEAKYAYVKKNLKKDNTTTIAYLNDLVKAKYKDSIDIRNDLLGTTTKTGVKYCINYSKTDTKKNIKTADNKKPIYFHVVVTDKKLYNKKLTVQFKTSVGYTQKTSIVLTKNKNSYALYYPKTGTENYTVEFKLIGSDNSTLAKQTVTIK